MHDYEIIFLDDANQEVCRRVVSACDDWDVCLRGLDILKEIEGATDFQVVY